MPKHYIYCLLKKGIPYYVGQTTKPRDRILFHIGLIKYNNGKSYEILQSTRIKQKADRLERAYVQLFESFGFELKNITLRKKSIIKRNYKTVFVKRALKYGGEPNC